MLTLHIVLFRVHLQILLSSFGHKRCIHLQLCNSTVHLHIFHHYVIQHRKLVFKRLLRFIAYWIECFELLYRKIDFKLLVCFVTCLIKDEYF